MQAETTTESTCSLKNARGTADGIEPIGLPELRKKLLERAGNWPKRVANRLFVRDAHSKIRWLDNQAALFSWVQSEIQPIRWYKNVGCVTKEEFFEHLRSAVEPFDGIEHFPHEPLLTNHYYACGVPVGPPSGKLDELVAMFGVASDLDRQLIKSMVMTLFWGGRAGARPVFVITSDQGPGSGKTTLADVVSVLVDGSVDASPKDDVAQLKTRLLSNDATGKRIVLIDNIKSAKFSWADFEALVTRPVISGRGLYVGESRRPNIFNWLVTLNGISLSADIAQRSVVIKLKRTTFDATFRERVFNFAIDHRDEIISDALGALRSIGNPTNCITTFSRWGNWEDQVLNKLPDPQILQQTIVERQAESDDDLDEADILREYVVFDLRANGLDPDGVSLQIDSQIAASWVNRSMGGSRLSTNTACRKLQDLIRRGKIPQLTAHRAKDHRFYIWRGKNVRHEGVTVYLPVTD